MVNKEIEIVKLSQWFFNNIINIIALKDCNFIIDGNLRPIKITLYKWDNISVKIPKSYDIENMDKLQDIVTQNNKRDFPNWEWQ